MRTLLVSLGLAVAAVLLFLPSTGTAVRGDVALTGGVPVRLAGDAQAEAEEGLLLLQEPPAGATEVRYGGATVQVLSVHSEYSQLPTGDRVGVVRSVTPSGPIPIPAGAATLSGAGPDFYLIAHGANVRLATSAPRPAAADAWTKANLQFTSLAQARFIAPPVAASLVDLVQDPSTQGGTLRLDQGTYEARAMEGTATLDVSQLVVFDATLTIHGVPHVSRLVQAQLPGGLYTPGVGWSGPGTHLVEDVALIVLEPTQSSLTLSATAASPIQLYANDVRLSVDGYAVFPWARGYLRTADEDRRVDGEQVVLGGSIQLRTVSVDLERAPAITFMGVGELDLLQVGPPRQEDSTAAVALVAGGSVALLAAAGATLYYWPLLKPLTLGALAPLYARLPKDKILEHQGRSQVYDLVRAEPGISTHKLAGLVDFGWSTLMYHLRVLERNEKIVSVRDGRYKRFFDRESGKYANGRKVLVAVLKNEATFNIGRLVLETPGITQKELSERLGLAPSSVHWHVERLTAANLLEKRRDGHNIRYFPGAAWKEVSPEDVGLAPVATVPLLDATPAAMGGVPLAPPAAAMSASLGGPLQGPR